MDDTSTIRSAANPAWKRVGAVLAGKDRDHIVLEGDRLIEDALRAGVGIEALFVDEARTDVPPSWRDARAPLRAVASSLLRRASGLTTPQGSLALAARPRGADLGALQALPRTLVLVAAGVSDPGNLGALARSAEAAGATALVALEGCASPWNSKALRGSMGALLRLPVIERATAAEVARELGLAGMRQVRAGTRGGANYADFDWSGPLALWVASETGDIPAEAREFESVTIPMCASAESLNVAVAASILLFAAGRWREAVR
jgi:RNA methyltransferase, TrmH family